MLTFSLLFTMFLEYLKHVFSFDPKTPLLFTQMQFWVFFAIIFAFFSLIVAISQIKDKEGKVHSRHLMRNGYLLLVSLLFYYKTSGFFVGLLLLVTISDFFIAQRIYKCREQQKTLLPRLWLALSVCIDLGILFYFKYSYFFVDVFNSTFGTTFQVSNIAAKAANWVTSSNFFSVDKIILPVGISFYTFQVISYTVDVFRGKIKPVRNILDFGFYVSFFPQLVAGPIIKADQFIPQLYKAYHLSQTQFGIALFWVLNGLVKKIVLSDYLAVNFIDRVFANPQLFSGFENLAALFTYSLQVYADFSGYTDIAIGLSMVMGFYLPMNFNSPYKAINCQGFWRRWHISLSTWLKNYVYYPLGGNRSLWIGTSMVKRWFTPEQGKLFMGNVNSMLVMLVGGMWHGASWNFIIWGALNGIGMVICKVWHVQQTRIQALILLATYAILLTVNNYYPTPLGRVLIIMAALVPLLTWIVDKLLAYISHGKCAPAGSILYTFIFITFTRLFFRSSSNLDPAIANETAWQTAKQMINSIGSSWNVAIPEVISAYKIVFALFAFGMLIHWLPTDWKRRYRIWFAKQPLPLMAISTMIIVFIVYQFVSAEMQPFIYFQF